MTLAGAILAALGGTVILFWLLANLVFLRRAKPAEIHCRGPVVLLLPLAGAPPDLPALLQALARQSLQPVRMIVAVEEGDEKAMLAAMSVPLPFPLEIVTAAPVAHRGQKCSNLLAGLALLTPEEPVVVLLDADIRPPSWWLSTLASLVLEGTADLVTGYRWLQPGRGVWTHFVAWLDRSVVALPRVR
ncbi:glycosyltransferase [Roseomonas sp. WA12]